MEKQLSIDDAESLFVNDLTTRQWKLHKLLLANAGVRLDQMYILSKLDGIGEKFYELSAEQAKYPQREKNDLTCKRELQKDIEAIKRSMIIQQVYVGGKYNNTVKEAEYHLAKVKISALKELAFVSRSKMKLSLNGQQRMVFKSELDHWESTLKIEEQNLEKMEKEFVDEYYKEKQKEKCETIYVDLNKLIQEAKK